MEARDYLAFASNTAGISFNESGVHIGHSAAQAFSQLIGVKTFKELGLSREQVRQTQLDLEVKKILEASQIHVTKWYGVQTDCPYETVEAAINVIYENKLEGVLGLGGGSVLDTAKAIVAVADGSNMEARANLAFASNLAGIAFNESGVHVGHASAHALGHLYHIPHGVCCANLTPAVIMLQSHQHPEKMKKLGEIMGAVISTDNAYEIGRQAAKSVQQFVNMLGIPSFKDQGFSIEQLMAAVPMIKNDPLAYAYDGEITETQIIDILRNVHRDL